MHTRGIWPTSPRDALVVGFAQKTPEGKYIQVATSIDSHPNFKPRTSAVRMSNHLIGQIVGPDLEGRKGLCHVVQIVDADLNG
jgi:hypothetical protein